MKCLCGTTSIKLVTQTLFSAFQRTFFPVTSLNAENGLRFVKSFYPLIAMGNFIASNPKPVSTSKEISIFLVVV